MGIRPPAITGLTEWRPLARGGFAMVWQARQSTLNRLVAVKVDDRQLDTASERRRFLREAGAAGRMSGHTGIVTVHDAGILSDDRPYLVMELCPGGSLNSWVRRSGPPSQSAVVDVGIRIAGALADAHEFGVIHRDIKPANILIDAYGHAGLADFGLAAIPEPDAGPDEAVDALTPAFAPPELLAGEPAVALGDVYSLAATLYWLLAGHSPRWAEPGVPTPAQIAARRGQPIDPIEGVSPDLMDVLLGALADDPAARPTAAEFRDELAGVAALADTVPVPAVAPRVDRTWVVLLGVGVIVLGLAAALVVGLFADRDSGAAVVPRGAVPSGASSVSSGTSSSPAGTPTPAAVPKGFVDCSARIGAPAVCPVKPECWTGVFSYMDSPRQAVSQACRSPHVYQTLAAVQLSSFPRKQSEIDADPAVKAVCNRRVLDKVLVGPKVDSSWEVMAIPPQFTDDTVYRCIFGKGTRTGALDVSGH